MCGAIGHAYLERYCEKEQQPFSNHMLTQKKTGLALPFNLLSVYLSGKCSGLHVNESVF